MKFINHVLILLAFGTATLVATETPVQAEQSNDAEYQQHFRRGVELFRAGNHEAALTEFVWAHRLRGHFAILLNIAYCYAEMNRVPDAVDHFERYLEEGGRRVAGRRRAEVERELRRLRAQVAELTVTVNVDGATVLVDEREVGTSPLSDPIRVRTGAVHTVEARLEGFRVAQHELTVAPGTTPPPVALELTRIRLTGQLSVQSEPIGARVMVDGQEVGETPWSGDLEAGSHQVEIRAGGFNSTQREVAISAGGELALVVSLDRAGPPARLHVRSTVDGAVVFIDGERIGTTPLEPVELASGPHEIGVEAATRESWSGELFLDGGQLTTADVRLAESGRGIPSPVFWSSLALALAAGAGALVTGVLATTRNSELEEFLADVREQGVGLDGYDDYGDLETRRAELQESGQDLALTTDVLWISAAVFGAATLIMGFFTRFGPARSTVNIEAGGTIVQDSASFSLQGRF